MNQAFIKSFVVIIVCMESTAERVWADALYITQPGQLIKLQDINTDGDFFDFSEISVYTDGLPMPLGRITAHTSRLFVADPISATVRVIDDLNGDGDALDFAESALFGQLPESIPPAMLTGLAARADGALYATDAALGILYVLQDVNADGDALDFGETIEVANGLLSPTAVAVRPDGILLITQPSPVVPVRILEDRNADNDFLDFAENLSYAENIPPGEDITATSETIAYLTRPVMGEVIALRDLTGDDDVLDFGEIVIHATGLNSPHVLTGDGSGGLYVATGDAMGTMVHVRDLNGDGDALDFGEVINVAEGVSQPTGIVFVPAATIGCIQGDINNDAIVSIEDMAPFVSILVGTSSPPDTCPADMNMDGQINGNDIQPFINVLTANP